VKRQLALAIGFVAAAAAAVAVAFALFGGDGQSRLSPSYLRAAQRPCTAFKHSVQPLLVSAGFDGLVRQTNGFQRARARLADDLWQLTRADDDRRRLEPLLQNLAMGDSMVIDAQRLDAAGKVPQAFRRLDDYARLLDAQSRLTKRLGLRDCG
jgi:hypothetical protein